MFDIDDVLSYSVLAVGAALVIALSAAYLVEGGFYWVAAVARVGVVLLIVVAIRAPTWVLKFTFMINAVAWLGLVYLFS